MPLKLDGFDGIARQLQTLADSIDTEKPQGGVIANRILNEGADTLLSGMRRQTQIDPVRRSGELHDALNKSRVRNRAASRGGKYITVGVHRKDWHEEDYYPAYVEYGHGGPAPAPPHSYIRSTYDAQKDDIYETIKDSLEMAVDDARKG